MSTVLIAAAASLAALTQRDEFKDAHGFADTDALRALQAITRLRPATVVLDSVFAATSRGTALITRIKADPSLTTCEVRVVSHSDTASASAPTSPPAIAAPLPAAPETLDPAGTRRVPRFEVIPGVELLVDGNPATLVDLSTNGAQLTSSTSLKPNQRVRLTLPGPPAPIRLNGAISWAVYEMPSSGPVYRAGVDFVDPDTAGIQRFIEMHSR